MKVMGIVNVVVLLILFVAAWKTHVTESMVCWIIILIAGINLAIVGFDLAHVGVATKADHMKHVGVAIVVAAALLIAVGAWSMHAVWSDGGAVAEIPTKTVTMTPSPSSTPATTTSATPTTSSATTSGSGTSTLSKSGSWVWLNATVTAEWTFSVSEKDRSFVFVHDCSDSDTSHVRYADGNPPTTAKCVMLQNHNTNYDISVAWSWKFKP